MKLPSLTQLFTKSAPAPSTPTTPALVRVTAPTISQKSDYSVLRGSSGSIYALPALSPYEIVSNYLNIPPLNTAISRISAAVANLPIILVDKKTRQPQPDHPAALLLSRPNGMVQKTRADFIRDMTIWYLFGNAYPLLAGNPSRPPLEMHLLNPLYVAIESTDGNKTGNSIRYNPNQGGGQTIYTYDPRKQRFYSADNAYQELYHLNNFNPTLAAGDYGGRSEAESLYYEVNHYIIGSRHNLGLLSNGARPSGIMTLKGQNGMPANLSDDAFARLQQQINTQYTGAGNAGRPLVLEGGLEWQEMQISPKDLDYDNLSRSAEEMIYKVLGVPIQLVTSDKATAGNMTNIRLEFYQNRVIPIGEDVICDHLDNFLLSRYPDAKNLEFAIDKDAIDVLIDQRVKKRTAIEHSIALTINEKRAIFNLPPVKNGDKIVDPNGRPIAGEDAELTVAPASAPTPATKPPEITD
jgi:HK97 family phage portal protein